jgi:drug/metabolite transporter (DMT)-like permease
MESNRSSISARRGYALAASAAVLWGLSGTISKYLLLHQVRPADLLALRTTLAAILLFSWFGYAAPQLLRLRRADFSYFALLGVAGLMLSQFLYYSALDLTSVGFALLLQYLAPLLLMSYGVLAKTERLTAGKVTAAGAAIGGCALMIFGQYGGAQPASLAGAVLAVGSAFAFAFYTGYGKHGLRRYDARTMLAYVFLVSSVTWIVLRPPWALPWRSYDLSTWTLIICLASLVTALPHGLYLASLRHLEASRSNLTTMIEPVVATSIAWLWLGERLQPLQIVGGMAVLGGVLLLQLEHSVLARRVTGRLRPPCACAAPGLNPAARCEKKEPQSR